MLFRGLVLRPAAVPDLRIAVTGGLLPRHEPKYELRRNGTIHSTYEVRMLAEARVEATYRLSPQVLLLNELYWRSGPRRVENVLGVDYALF